MRDLLAAHQYRPHLAQHFEDVARGYKVMLSAFGFDPQKLGKNEGVYPFAEGEFEKAMLKQAATV